MNSTHSMLADVDGDGRPEIVEGDWDEHPVRVCQIGASSLSCEEVGPSREGYGSSNGAPGVGDIDGDGLMDLVLPGAPLVSGPALACAQQLDVSFDCAEMPVSNSADAVALLDIDEDGDLDAFLPTFRNEGWWCENVGGAYGSCGSLGWTSGGSVRLLDVEGDGDEELVYFQQGAAGIDICQGEGLERLSGCSRHAEVPCMYPWVGRGGFPCLPGRCA